MILTNSGSCGKIKFTLEYLIFLKLLINMMISVLPMNLLTILVRFLFVVISLILTSLLTLLCLLITCLNGFSRSKMLTVLFSL